MINRDRLLEYLYGEMTKAEREDFEKILTQDPELRAELAALQQTRRQLADLSDIHAEPAVVTLPVRRRSWRKWIIRTGVAAGFLLLLSLFDARLQVGADGLVFSLGQPDRITLSEAPLGAAPLSQADLLSHLTVQEENLNRKLNAMDSVWQRQFLHREHQLQTQWENRLTAFRAGEREQLQQLVEQLQKENLPKLAGLLQSIQLEQQRELRATLTELWYDWQQTRAADLESIETEFVNIYRNTERNQLETEVLLRNILTNRNL